MLLSALGAGLTPRFPSPPPGALEPDTVVTEEAGLQIPTAGGLRVRARVEEGQVVAQGAPLAALREAPEIVFAAPISGRVARIEMRPGHRLAELVLFREPGGDTATADVSHAGTEAGLRALLQGAGAWPLLRRRPFGGMPAPDEAPVAIVVMAADTRPFAPDPATALRGRQEAFARGLHALARLTEGPVFVVQMPGPPLAGATGPRIHTRPCGPRHPQGAAGIRIHGTCPAEIDAPVWDVHAEDVAALGDLLETGLLTMTRHVSVAGGALREARLLRSHSGADLRALTHRAVAPGAHLLLSGSPLDGRPARWLGLRDRQVSALPRAPAAAPPHWLVAALTRSARPQPIIPTAALRQALGAALPVAPFVRALAAGDDEAAMKLGLLSLLEEDVALADYALGGEAQLAGMLRTMLDRIQTEFAP